MLKAFIPYTSRFLALFHTTLVNQIGVAIAGGDGEEEGTEGGKEEERTKESHRIR